MKKLKIVIFALLFVVQLYIPAQMIWSHEKTITTGEVFKFRSAPVDPSDPFRGKYIVLNFEATQFDLPDTTIDWNYDERVYVALDKDEDGFVRIKQVSREKPLFENYVEATVSGYYKNDDPPSLFLTYDFDRFYMEESKAYDAEIAYRESLNDSVENTYALVHILEGRAVVTDVYINDVPILDLLKN